MRGGDNMGFRFWFGRTVVFSAGFFTPTSLATVARIGFYTRGQAARDWFLFGWWLFFNEHPLPGLLGNHRPNFSRSGSLAKSDGRLESRPNPRTGMSALHVAQAFQPASSGDFPVPSSEQYRAAAATASSWPG